MSFTGNFLCTSFKVELLKGVHDFTPGTGDTFKIALYTSSATLNASTTAYSATNEVSGTGYTAGGETLTSIAPTSSGTTAYLDFSDVTWSASTITARGALIYNSTAAGNPAVAVLDFGVDKTSSANNFVVSFPTANASEAVVRIT
jgi:hypothetical protein